MKKTAIIFIFLLATIFAKAQPILLKDGSFVQLVSPQVIDFYNKSKVRIAERRFSTSYNIQLSDFSPSNAATYDYSYISLATNGSTVRVFAISDSVVYESPIWSDVSQGGPLGYVWNGSSVKIQGIANGTISFDARILTFAVEAKAGSTTNGDTYKVPGVPIPTTIEPIIDGLSVIFGMGDEDKNATTAMKITVVLSNGQTIANNEYCCFVKLPEKTVSGPIPIGLLCKNCKILGKTKGVHGHLIVDIKAGNGGSDKDKWHYHPMIRFHYSDNTISNTDWLINERTNSRGTTSVESKNGTWAGSVSWGF